MKYVIILCDGLADGKNPALGGKTPMQAANAENIKKLVALSEIGLCRTVPEGFKPGSDVANLSVMGYDPKLYYKGRSSLEAASMGVNLNDDDVTMRCNLLHLSDAPVYEDRIMEDYSGGNISTAEAEELVKAIDGAFGSERITFHTGTTYKHCAVLRHGGEVGSYTPPHDISGKRIGDFLPKGDGSEEFLDMMKASHSLLKDHPVNVRRRATGLTPADDIWFWGAGTKPVLPDFYSKTGLKGGVISAVDLVRGIGILAGMEIINVPGITGGIDTDFYAKARYALDFLRKGNDFVYIHIDAPDECAHKGDLSGKIRAFENIDNKVLGTILKELKGQEFSILVMPDHFTSLKTRTHTSAPVPYMIYSSVKNLSCGQTEYSEEAAESGVYMENGYELIDRFISSAK